MATILFAATSERLSSHKFRIPSVDLSEKGLDGYANLGAAQRRRLPAPDMLVAVSASMQAFAVI